jgi:hypothetical protein
LRGRCFKTQDELDRFYNKEDTTEEPFTIDFVLETLTNDLIKREIATKEALDQMSRLDFAIFLLDTYLKYPLPAWSKAMIPYNYCALQKGLKGFTA